MVTCLISAGKRAFYLLIKRGNQVVSYIADHCSVYQFLVLIYLLKEYISVVAFLRVQWEPFETRFGKINSNFTHHLDVLGHSIQAIQYNAIHDGNRAAEIERQRMLQKESGMSCPQVFSSLVKSVLAHWVTKITEEKRNHFMRWICTIDFEKEHAMIFEKRYTNTGNWLLRKPSFRQWFDATDSCVLWCYGKRKNFYII